MRIDNSGSLRQDRPAAMVIGYNQFHSKRAREFGLFGSGDAGINGDDEVNFRCKPFDGGTGLDRSPRKAGQG